MKNQRNGNEVLRVEFGLIQVLSALGLIFRGHSENFNDTNCGVYLCLLKFIAARDPLIREHLSGD